MQKIEQACIPSLRKLLEEIELCIRYYSATFPITPLEQIVFVGASAAHRRLCQKLAAELQLPGQAGDVLAHIPAAESLDPSFFNVPSPAWAVAVGLSVGALDKAA